MKKGVWKTISDAMGTRLWNTKVNKKIDGTGFQREKGNKKDNKSGATNSDTIRWFAYKRLLFLTDRDKPMKQM